LAKCLRTSRPNALFCCAAALLPPGEDKTQFFPGAEEGLASLAGRSGLVLAVATGKSRRGLDRELDLLGARRWFTATRTADCSKSKPDPQMLLDLLDETGTAPGACLMVGDSLLDLRMAAAAGVRSLAVGFGAEPEEDLLRGGSVCCVGDWPSLVAKIEELAQNEVS
jgi:phosphoglycolate phosphatase